MVKVSTNLKISQPNESGAKISLKQQEKQDALELARLIYDIFMENQTNDTMNNRGEND